MARGTVPDLEVILSFDGSEAEVARPGRAHGPPGESRTTPDLAGSARSNGCVRLTAAGGELGFEPVWATKKVVSQPASPRVHRGHAYFVTKAGLVHCFDPTTAEERYAERLDGVCWATPVGAGDRVHFFGKDGVSTVPKAGPEYVKLAAVWDSRLDQQQGNPAHQYEYDGRFHLANDKLNGYTRIDPNRYEDGFPDPPRFLAGGGHITLAVVGDTVGQSCRIDGGGWT